jgi:D-3-phosphoglycerate dehydrogenase / 2-oxoglutarate reductase
LVKILVCDEVQLDELGLGESLTVDYAPKITRDDLLNRVGDYDALIIRSRTRVDKDVLDRAVRLKLIARPGTGLDNVDTEYAKKKGVTVVNSPESLVEAVSEHVVLLMLGLSRKVVAADVSTKAGRWEKNSLMGREVRGKTLGIIGLGRIGRRIGQVSKVLGMRIIIHDVIPIPQEVLGELEATVVSLDDLLRSSDYVTLHVPLTDDTRHMIGEEKLAIMKKGAYLINTSRGGVVDEESLSKALQEGRLGGAGLDVFESEPPSGAILQAPNTILTPHIGGQTKEAQTAAIRVVGEKVSAFFKES